MSGEAERGSDESIELIRSAQSGDPGAWEQLYERYGPELCARVRARLGPELRVREESVDLVQTVWLEAFRNLHRFEYRGEESFLAWITAVLRNEIGTRLERARTVKRGAARSAKGVAGTELLLDAVPRAEPGPSTGAELDEEQELLLQAVASLPAAHADLVRWAVLEELPLAEIARRLEVTEGAARMRAARATARLTREFRRLCGGFAAGTP